MANLLEGFGQWLQGINVDPKYAADQTLILSNIILTPENGAEPIHYKGLSMFRIIKSDPKQRWAVIQDVSHPDEQNPQLSAFPHALSPSPHAGKKFVIRGDQFDKLLAPRMPAAGAAPPGGAPGGLPI